MNDGCYAYVGYQAKGSQQVNLAPASPGRGCFHPNVVIHEFLHGLFD